MNDVLNQQRLEEGRQILTTIALKMAVPLYFLFWGLDLLYVPQHKWDFLALRCLIIPTALITLWWLKHAYSFRQIERAALFLIFMCGAIINLMIFFIGVGSLYVIPLQLVAIGGLTFFPYTTRYFIYTLVAVYAPYYAIELSRIQSRADIHQLSVYTFFTIGVVVISKAIHYYRDQLMNREYAIRKDLESEIAFRHKTEQQLIEARDQALAATKAKETFLANMSHEIRTPLTAIIGFAEYLLDKSLSVEERMAALTTIVNSGNHLLSIINDILDFSKIEADAIELEQDEVNPIQLAADVQSLIMPLASKKALDISLHYQFPLPARITTDPVRLKQILINVCTNAIKFSKQGSITITLDYVADKHLMIFRIKDSGIGMTTAQLEKIFTPFKQADSSITRRFGGTGLGLSLSQRLARLLGGDLQVNSELNVGSEFVISIDSGQPQDATMLQNIEQVNETTARQQDLGAEGTLQGKILLAEDNETNQRLFSLYLRKMGLDVTLVNNGAEAIQHALANDYDLILMDMQMPVMSGIDATTQLRQQGYDKPIIALTANATKEDRRQCMEAGCEDFVTKPVTNSRLYQAIAAYLSAAVIEPSNAVLTSALLDEEPELADVVSQFVTRLPQITSSISTAFQQNDWHAFKTEVHKLKGMGGGIGYPQLTEVAVGLEQSFSNSNHAAIAAGIVELRHLTDRIRAGKPTLLEV